MDNLNLYSTKDLGECTVLLTCGFKLNSAVWKGSIVYFSFENGAKAKEVAYQYHFDPKGVEVSAKKFYENLITIKTKYFPYPKQRKGRIHA